MVLWTQSSYIRVFSISTNEIKQIGNVRRFENSRGLIGHIKSCSINISGNKVGIISSNASGSSSVSFSFHIYDLDTDSFIVYEFTE